MLFELTKALKHAKAKSDLDVTCKQSRTCKELEIKAHLILKTRK